MKNSTLIIILLLVMNCVTLKIALDNRNLIASTLNMLDNVGQVFEDELNGRIEDE